MKETVINFTEKYKHNPLIKGLIQLTPISAAIDSGLSTYVELLKKNRLKIFFEELSKGEILLDENLLQNEDFIFAYFSTLNASIRSRRVEKISFFTNLLKNSFVNEKVSSFDEYEEILKIIDDLTFRELETLICLYKYEAKYDIATGLVNQEKANTSGVFWQDFLNELRTEYLAQNEEILNYLKRLERSGCYQIYFGMFGNDKQVGYLTPLFYKVQSLVVE